MDSRAIARAIERVLDDPAHARGLREAGLAHSQRFDWDKTAAQTLAFYRTILGR
jgi:glycosyltransferase involved in cell wall biosynthesis